MRPDGTAGFLEKDRRKPRGEKDYKGKTFFRNLQKFQEHANSITVHFSRLAGANVGTFFNSANFTGKISSSLYFFPTLPALLDSGKQIAKTPAALRGGVTRLRNNGESGIVSPKTAPYPEPNGENPPPYRTISDHPVRTQQSTVSRVLKR